MSKKDKTMTQAIEFQPDALEIKQSRLPFFARFTPYAAFFMMAGAIIWATIGKTDTVVQAPGKLVSDEHNIMMKPREITVIKKVHVEEGDIVKANQILMTFDPENYKSEQERLESEISTLEAQFERLFAEFNQKVYAPKKQTRDTLWQLEIHKQRMAYYRERMN
jgi:multidrug efflux pump subunit AcrA (membrane-fusion protein)